MSRRVLLLLALGLLHMAADLCRLPIVAAAAAATGASPRPKVFTEVGGLEPFSMAFALHYRDHDGQAHGVPINAARYAGLRGAYNRRNAYGAAIAGGPVLEADPRTRPMLRAVLRHAVCGERPILRELGIDPATVAGSVSVHYTAGPGRNENDLPLTLEVDCP